MWGEPPAKRTFGQLLGLAAAAVGVGVLGAYALDLHSHQCARCNTKWRHLGAFNVGDFAAHSCPNCGEVQWWKGVGGDGALVAPLEIRDPKKTLP